MLQWPDKDPDEVLDYAIDWSARLETGDTIVASTWTVQSGLSSSLDSFSGSRASVWLSGGSEGQTYVATNRVTTSENRVMEQSVKIRVRSK